MPYSGKIAMASLSRNRLPKALQFSSSGRRKTDSEQTSISAPSGLSADEVLDELLGRKIFFKSASFRSAACRFSVFSIWPAGQRFRYATEQKMIAIALVAVNQRIAFLRNRKHRME